MADKKFFLVTAVSSFKMQYCVFTENEEWAEDTVAWGGDGLSEYKQTHLGEVIIETREVSKEEFLAAARKNGYCDTLPDEKIIEVFGNDPDADKADTRLDSI